MNNINLFFLSNFIIIIMNVIFIDECNFLLIAKKNQEKYTLELFSLTVIYILSLKIFYVYYYLDINHFISFIFFINYLYFVFSTFLCIFKITKNKEFKILLFFFPLLKRIDIKS